MPTASDTPSGSKLRSWAVSALGKTRKIFSRVLAFAIVFRAKVASSASRDWKLCTGSTSSVRLLAGLVRAAEERCAGAPVIRGNPGPSVERDSLEETIC